MAPKTKTGTTKLTHMEFVENAIAKRKDPQRSKGIHVRYSGFNDAFRVYFGVEPREAMDALLKQGLIALVMRRGGPMIYLAADAAEVKQQDATDRGKSALAKLGLAA